MKTKRIVETTTNRSEFNRAYKNYLESIGRIKCTYCKYHKYENKTDKYYGGFDNDLRIPNWKLVSKNPKQWMKKPLKYNVSICLKKTYIEIKF